MPQARLKLTPTERKQLAEILGCPTGKLQSELATYATAALEEYVRMFLGQRVFTRGSDIREYRLMLLIRTAFDNLFPDDQTVCDLFQTRLTEARSLIRAVSAKFQYELADAKTRTLKGIIQSARQAQGAAAGADWLVSIGSLPLVELLNRELQAISSLLPPVTLSPNTISTYVIPDASYQQLLGRFP